jgi:integrase
VMADMPRPRPPHLQREITRHGKAVWYVRVGKGPRIRLKAEYGTPEFTETYRAALAGEQPKRDKTPASGTLAWLIERYRDSTAWTSLSVATRRQRENIFKNVCKTAGSEPVKGINRKAILAGRDRRKETPNAARHFVQAMRGLFAWAVGADHVVADPTFSVHAPRPKTEGFAMWPSEWQGQFERRWPLGTRERLAYEVLLQTGLRRGDAVRLGRPHFRGDIGTIRTEKGFETVTIVINPELRAAIEAGPIGELTFIASKTGRPLTKEGFGNWFSEACRAAGVPGSAHGLRKARATIAAERGATDSELDAMFGWRDGKTSKIYTRNVDRTKLAISGAGKANENGRRTSIPAPRGQVRARERKDK